MNLSATQISEIKNFISRKGIKYQDVQMEVIDHVATAVEEKMNADGTLSFESALNQTHASFGIFGFSTMEDSISNGLSKKYTRIFWGQFLSLFGLRYLPLVVFAVFTLYKVQVLINDDQSLLTISFFSIIGLLTLAIVYLNRNAYKDFLVYKISAMYLVYLSVFFQIFNVVLNLNAKPSVFGLQFNFLMASITIVVFCVYVFSALKTVQVGIEESKHLKERYQLLDY